MAEVDVGGISGPSRSSHMPLSPSSDSYHEEEEEDDRVVQRKITRTASASPGFANVVLAARGAVVRDRVKRSQSQLPPRQRRTNEEGKSRRESSDSQKEQQLTLVLLGAPRVGKTALVNQFLWEIFIHDYHPTVEEFNWIEYDCSIPSGDVPADGNLHREENRHSSLILKIIDSSGSRDFLAMRHLYYRTSDAFMIVYALNDEASYSEALAMLKEVEERNPNKHVPILLVANKADLRPNTQAIVPTPARSATIADEATHRPAPRHYSGIETVRISAKNLEQQLVVGEMAREKRILVPDRRQSVASGSVRALHLQKRRQSMPSRRTANDLGIDADTLESLMRKHEDSKRNNCTVS